MVFVVLKSVDINKLEYYLVEARGNVVMDLKNIRFIGRHIVKDGQGYFAFSGSGFEFAVEPSAGCLVKLVFNSVIREESSQFIAIYINDVYFSKYMLINGKGEIIIPIAKHSVVRIIKVNEAYLSSLYLEDIVFTNGEFGELKPVNRKLIGFFGDSLTCGFGLLDYHGDIFRMETEDFTKTYAFLTSNAVNMDYSVVARSGISVAIPMYMSTLFGDIYDTVDMFEKYTPERQLDYAVVNLGANDNSGIFQNARSEDREKALDIFKEGYQALVERILNDNPKASLLLCYQLNHLDERTVNKIKEVKEYVSSNYENKCCLVEFIPNKDGACFHPFFLTHAENAKILAKAIQELEAPEEKQ